MGWNDFHITLAPIGSEVTRWTDSHAKTATGEAVQMIDVRPPDKINTPVYLREFESWINSVGFKLGQPHPAYTTYSFQEMILAVKVEKGIIISVRATFLVNSNARERIEIWNKLIRELCDGFQMKLVDPERGMVEPTDFLRLVESSFAWECFLKRERG